MLRAANDYKPLGPRDESEVRFSFDGPFQGRPVLWQARLLTVARARELLGPSVNGPFIEVGEPTADGRALTVAVDVPSIVDATILCTIVMIRQYRRLRVGRLEFGSLPGLTHRDSP